MKLLILFVLCFFSLNTFAKSANSKIIDSVGIATDTSSIISTIVNLGEYDKFSVFSYLEPGSSATGTVSILLSNDVTNDPDLVSHWAVHGSDKVFTTVIKDLLSNITDSAAKWMKVSYTKQVAEGTGTATVSTIIYIP